MDVQDKVIIQSFQLAVSEENTLKGLGLIINSWNNNTPNISRATSSRVVGDFIYIDKLSTN
jgi:hypothetical protein